MDQLYFSDDWYAVFVTTGKEDSIKEFIQYTYHGRIRAVVPKRKLRERKGGIWTYNIRTLFPGYVLLNGTLEDYEYFKIKDIPGVIKLLSNDCKPLRIEPEEIEIISRMISNGETIGFSNILIENSKVVVVDGPLTSLEGLILEVNRRKGRAKVRLNFMGEPRIVELGVSVLQPIRQDVR